LIFFFRPSGTLSLGHRPGPGGEETAELAHPTTFVIFLSCNDELECYFCPSFTYYWWMWVGSRRMHQVRHL